VTANQRPAFSEIMIRSDE